MLELEIDPRLEGRAPPRPRSIVAAAGDYKQLHLANIPGSGEI